MNTYPAQNAGKGHFFPDNSVGLIPFRLRTHSQVTGDINMGRTGGFARNQIRLPGCRLHGFVHQGPGGTHLHTGGTKLTAGVFKGFGDSADLNLPVTIIDKTQRLDSAHITAGTHAACAANAEIIISFKQRMIFEYR